MTALKCQNKRNHRKEAWGEIQMLHPNQREWSGSGPLGVKGIGGKGGVRKSSKIKLTFLMLRCGLLLTKHTFLLRMRTNPSLREKESYRKSAQCTSSVDVLGPLGLRWAVTGSSARVFVGFSFTKGHD